MSCPPDILEIKAKKASPQHREPEPVADLVLQAGTGTSSLPIRPRAGDKKCHTFTEALALNADRDLYSFEECSH